MRERVLGSDKSPGDRPGNCWHNPLRSRTARCVHRRRSRTPVWARECSHSEWSAHRERFLIRSARGIGGSYYHRRQIAEVEMEIGPAPLYSSKKRAAPMERVFATNDSDDMVLVILAESDEQHPGYGNPCGSGAW
jgi:hypothetical protein